jgi:outer membrane receptor for ferrienterochelin and colicins
MKRALFALALMCAWLFGAGPLWAQTAEREAEAPNLEALEAILDQPVVTTASRAAERVQTAPSAMFTITAEDIRAFGMRSIDEALDYLGVGMRVEKVRDYESGIDVGAQGLMLRDDGRHLLVLLDGHVMNSQTDGSVSLHEGLGVPLEAIDHIEVMLGAGSVMYGANAMTAVVNVVTKDAQRERGGHAVMELSMAPPSRVNGYAMLPRGEHELGYHYRVGLGAGHSFMLGSLPASLALRAEWQQNFSQTYAVGKTQETDFELRPGESAWGGVASHRMQVPSSTLAFKLGDFTLRVQGSRYERSLPLHSLFNDQSAKETHASARLDLSHTKQLSQWFSLTSRAYADYVRYGESSNWTSPWWCLPGQIDGCAFSARHVSRWLGLEQQLRFEPRADGTLSTTLGYDVRLRDASARPADYRDAISGEYPRVTRLPYFHKQSVLGAVFAQQLYQPVAWFSMNLGARLDIDSLFGVHLSPRAALVFVPHETSSLRVSYAEAFRGPSALELYAGDLTYVVKPRSLGPEIVRTVELEWQQRISFVNFSIRGFAAFYEDFIAQRSATPEETDRAFADQQLASTVDPEWVVINDNLRRIRAFGGSATLSAKPVRGLSIAGSVTVSRTQSPGHTATLWPNSFGNLRLAYQFRPGGPTLAFASSLARGRRLFNTAANEDSINPSPRAPDALDMRLTLTSPIRAVDGLSVRAGGGVRVMPDTPYLLTGSPDDPASRIQYYHSLPQLHLLLGASYDY